MIGKTLAQYEITALLGKGGMGEVYRATDTTLGRDVALKVLPQELSRDPERAARFEREARVLASLQHPNIASIYGFENVDGVRFLTMELAAGDDLAQRLERGKLPLDDVVQIATEMAVGLEAAHQRSIIHRDLKPANVKVDTSGGVKILDFGLARAYTGEPQDDADLLNSPTISVAMTQAGVILGTAAYMSPEQAKGKAVDQRSDIWSYGVLALRAAQRPYSLRRGDRQRDHGRGHEGRDRLVGAARRIRRAMADAVAPHRCLDRDPDTRLQSIGEARIVLQQRDEGIAGLVAESPAKSSTRRPWFAVAAALLALAAAMVWQGTRPTPEASLVRSTLLPPADRFYSVDSPFAVSPDGHRIAFVATSLQNDVDALTGAQSLWVRDLAEEGATEIAGTEGAQYPFWSPDGRMLGFFANGKLCKVDLRGGPALTLCDTQSGRGGSWNEDGIIIFQRSWSEGLMKIAAGGGTPEPITTLSGDRLDVAHRWPRFLPDGRRFLFFVVNTTASEYSGIYLGSLDSDETRMIVRGDSRALYSEGHLLYRLGSTLMAHAVDEATMELRGDAIPIAADVPGGGISWGGAHFGVSRGLLVYLRGAGATFTQLVWRDREGNELGIIGDKANYGEIDLSHDGQRIAIVDGASTSEDVWLLDLERGGRTRLTFDPADDRSPIWAPDDDRIAFVSARGSVGEIYARPVSGNREATLLHATGTNTVLGDWSRDGRWIVYQSMSIGEDSWDVMAYDIQEEEEILLAGGPFVQQYPAVSPDGRWLAFTSGPPARPRSDPRRSRERLLAIRGAAPRRSPADSGHHRRPQADSPGPLRPIGSSTQIHWQGPARGRGPLPPF